MERTAVSEAAERSYGVSLDAAIPIYSKSKRNPGAKPGQNTSFKIIIGPDFRVIERHYPS
jgi:hypothetical protein